MNAGATFDEDDLRHGLEAVDLASRTGNRRFSPNHVDQGNRGNLYTHLLQRGWVATPKDTSITGDGQLRVPPQLTEDGKAALAVTELAELLGSEPHPATAEEAWTELIHALGPLSSAAEAAQRRRSELRRLGMATGRSSIVRAMQLAHDGGLR
jgi:hypothetical protein